MNLPLFIAGRYLFSKRKKNFINIISLISVVVVAIVTTALIVVLSVFNGLEELLRTLNTSFDPPLKIEVVEGKTFQATDSLLSLVESVPGVETVSQVIEDYAYARYRDANQVVMLKGVSENFLNLNRIDSAIVQGELKFHEGNVPYALVGIGLKYSLSIALEEELQALQIYYIKDVSGGTIDPARMYSRKSIYPGAVFSIMQNLDDNYIIVPLEFAADLMNYGNKRTSLEVQMTAGANPSAVQRQLAAALGPGFAVLNHQQQHKDLYKLLRMEKLFAFLAFSLLLGIGSINIFFSLMMLALDKKKDISILSAMGAQEKTIQGIFLLEGSLIGITGTLLGLGLGAGFCWLQLKFGMISMGMQSAVMEGYPVKMVFQDFLNVVLVMSVITVLISYRPAVLAARFSSIQHL